MIPRPSGAEARVQVRAGWRLRLYRRGILGVGALMHMPRLGYVAGVAIAIALILCPRPGLAADNAVALVTQFGDKTLQIVKDPLIGASDRERRFHVLLDEYFDIPAIARFVLGRSWRGASEDERQEFTMAFQDHMVRSYVRRFSDYGGERFRVMPARQEGDNGTIVPAEILRPDAKPPVTLDWKVQGAPTNLRIRDVSISGVSMAITYRDEFAAIVPRTDGHVAALIAALRSK